MKIKITENAGYCFGVKRAMKIIEEIDEENAYVLGKLIHNPQVIASLEEKGIKSIGDIEDLPENSTIIISAHGVDDRTKKELKKKNFRIIDSTCPLVENVHKITKEAEKEGHKIIIFGDKNHTEVKGIAGNLKEPIIISHIDEIRNIDNNQKFCLVSQTTQNIDEFNRIAEELKSRLNLKVVDTICMPTKQRQSSSTELAKKSDLMVVIGGKISANTKRLAQRCMEFTETYHIETEKELKKEWFKGKENIGITAGASTPDYLIKKVYGRIKNEF